MPKGKHENCIDLGQCKDRGVYKLSSRNLTIGVFDSSANSFMGIRTKFGNEFLDREIHWDADISFGTACPIEYMGDLPTDVVHNVSSRALFDCLKAMKE